MIAFGKPDIAPVTNHAVAVMNDFFDKVARDA
jgi:hypothetical protein